MPQQFRSTARRTGGRRPGRSFGPRRNHGGRPQRKGRTEFIDPARFVKVATISEEQAYVPTHRFTDFALEPLLHKNLALKGYETPSPIQDQTIPAALEGRDILGVASTGTGKTAAFALPMLQRLISQPNSRALVIAPTRELAHQIEKECRALAQGSRVRTVLLIGGAGMGPQLGALRQHPQLVIGTPGRIKDHLERGSLKLAPFNTIVLDEVDRMLDMGFVHDVTKILGQAAPERQSFFFSATIDAKVRTLIDTFSNDPYTVSLKASSASENVHQDVVKYATPADKLEKLNELIARDEVKKVIIFDETKRGVERLHRELERRGHAAESIHGGRTQGQRQRALGKFQQDKVNVLVATDVAARGIDVEGITHVVNYSIPNVYDDYIHRIGRAGRAGNVGYALTFVEHPHA